MVGYGRAYARYAGDKPGSRFPGPLSAAASQTEHAVCGGIDMETNKTLNTLLVTLFRSIMNIEQDALISGEFTDITMNDMHVIEAIECGEPRPSSVVAKKLSVTMGTLTKSVDRLSRTGYVLRERSEEDKRLVLLSLTEKGKRAYAHHMKFHEEMIQAAMGQFNKQEAGILIHSLQGLVDYFNSHKKG